LGAQILNVLFLSEQIYPHSSGAELATYLFAKSLSETGFNVKLVTNRFPDEPFFSQDGKVSIYRLPLYEKFGTVKYTVMAKVNVLFSEFFNRQIKWADVVYVPRFWFSVIPLAKAHGKPVVTHLHDYVAICPLTWAFDFSKNSPCKGNRALCSPKCSYCYEKTMNRPFKGMLASVALNSICGKVFSTLIGLSDAVICVSNAQKNIISQSGFLSSNKLSVVNNPVETNAEVPLKGNDFGYFGGLDRAKGIQTLYKAAVNLTTSQPKPFKIHATKISGINQEYLVCFRKMNFIPYGKLEKKQFTEVYQNISTIIVPSIWFEPWPYAVVEALLSRRYVIASKIGGIEDQVVNCKGVTLVEPGNVEQLEQAMNNVLNLDDETLLELGNQNRDAFRKRFSNEESLKQFIRVLESVI
jgi:glycosyltransferase involved in cell wall biosynthesis